MFFYISIELLDLVYFGLQVAILLCVLVSLTKLSLFQIQSNNSSDLRTIIYERKIISYNIMNFVLKFLTTLLSVIFSGFTIFVFCTNFFSLNTLVADNIVFLETSFSNFNFHNEINFSIIFWQFLIVATVVVILYSSYYFLQIHNRAMMEFPIIMLLATFFLCSLVSAADLFVVFITTVGFSLNTYVLILSNPDDKNCCEAGIKYFYLSAVSSGLIAFGLWITYLIFLTFNFISIENALKDWDIAADGSFGLITFLVFFLTFGFFFKLAAFPCHLWAAAVYEGSPQPIMAFFVLPIKIGVLAFVFKFFIIVLKDVYVIYSYLFWFSAIFSMLIGAFAAIIEKRIKKLFAYSSINQMGFLLIGATAGTSASIQASYVYLIIYVTMNLGLFIILLNTFDVKTKRNLIYLTDLTHFAKNNLKIAIMFSIILFSMAGIPPLAGFFGKFYLLLEAATQNYYSLVLIGMFTTLLSTFYYLRIIKYMLFDRIDFATFNFKTKLSPVLYFCLLCVVSSLSTHILWTGSVLYFL